MTAQRTAALCPVGQSGKTAMLTVNAQWNGLKETAPGDQRFGLKYKANINSLRVPDHSGAIQTTHF
jgi:hypothetical protein